MGLVYHDFHSVSLTEKRTSIGEDWFQATYVRITVYSD